MSRTPPADVHLTAALVQRLLAEQHPDLADLPLRFVTHGWDNATYRLGDDLAVRLPRRQEGVELIRGEQHWLPELARRLPVPVPEPLRVGGPGSGYPWPWSVVRWVPGVPVDRAPLDPAAAGDLGRLLAALHLPAPADAPANPFRGVPLRDREEAVAERLVTLDRPDLAELWDELADLPIDAGPTWLHGDLHPRNLVGDGGRLAGVIDWGDLTAGDPATDLAAAWMLFPVEAHGAVWAAYGELSEATLGRARGWALLFGAILLVAAQDDEDTFSRVGRETLERVAAA